MLFNLQSAINKTKTYIHHQHPSEPVFCTLLFLVNQAQHLDKCEPRNSQYKKLSYCQETTQRAMSAETMQNVAQMFVELNLISPATGE